MANIVGTRFTEGFNQAATTYDGPNEKLDISDALDTLSPTDTPLLLLIGRSSLSKPCTQVKHEWLEDAVIGFSTTTTDTDLNNTTVQSVTLTVAAGEGLKFRGSGTGTPATYNGSGNCDIVRISSGAGEELAVVTATASTSIDVARGYGSWNTPVDHTGFTKTITIVGNFQPQGLPVVGAGRTTTKVPQYNYTQIFQDSYKVTKTQKVTDKWLAGSDEVREVAKITKRFGRTLENALIFGKKSQGSPALTVGSTMDGIRTRITTNVFNKAGAKLQMTHMEDALVAGWQNDDVNDLYAIVNSTQRRVIGQMLDPWREVGYSDTTLGTFVNRYETPFGAVSVVLDRYMPDDEVLMIDKDRIGFGPMEDRALHETVVAPTSSEYEQREWIAEMTAEVRQESVHARITGLATTNVL